MAIHATWLVNIEPDSSAIRAFRVWFLKRVKEEEEEEVGLAPSLDPIKAVPEKVDKKTVKPLEKIRVVVADDDNQLARRLTDYFLEHGIDTRTVSSDKEARALILQWKPRFVIADLMLRGGNALSLIDFIKKEPSLRHNFISVLVTSGHNNKENVKTAYDRGAKDYIVKPFRPEDMLKRIIFHSRSYRQVSEIKESKFNSVDEATLMLHLTDLVLRQAMSKLSLDEILHNLTRMVSMRMDGVRCSIIHCMDHQRAIVVTSNDDKKATGIHLDLYKYPEVVHVMNTQQLVAIENIGDSAELRAIRDHIRNINFNSLIVCPVTRHGRPFGVLSLRMPPEKETISDNEIRFVEIVSHIASLVLGLEIHKENGDFWGHTETKSTAPIPLKAVKNS